MRFKDTSVLSKLSLIYNTPFRERFEGLSIHVKSFQTFWCQEPQNMMNTNCLHCVKKGPIQIYYNIIHYYNNVTIITIHLLILLMLV